ncbi:MAG: hypothetical protein ACOC93_06325 [Planctomycetota bacterium]
MRLDPTSYGFAVAIFAAWVTTVVVFCVDAWWSDISRLTWSWCVWLVSLSAGVIAFFVRRHTGD